MYKFLILTIIYTGHEGKICQSILLLSSLCPLFLHLIINIKIKGDGLEEPSDFWASK